MTPENCESAQRHARAMLLLGLLVGLFFNWLHGWPGRGGTLQLWVQRPAARPCTEVYWLMIRGGGLHSYLHLLSQCPVPATMRGIETENKGGA
jgi:hypothetical protein